MLLPTIGASPRWEVEVLRLGTMGEAVSLARRGVRGEDTALPRGEIGTVLLRRSVGVGVMPTRVGGDERV